MVVTTEEALTALGYGALRGALSQALNQLAGVTIADYFVDLGALAIAYYYRTSPYAKPLAISALSHLGREVFGEATRQLLAPFTRATARAPAPAPTPPGRVILYRGAQVRF